MERSLDALLDRSCWTRGSLDRVAPLPDGDPARWQPVAQVLAALTSAPESSELTGQARALAEFRAFASPGVAEPRRAAQTSRPRPAAGTRAG